MTFVVHDNKPNAFSDNLLETGVVVAKFDYCQRTLPKIATDNDKIVCTVGPHGTHGAGAVSFAQFGLR